VGLNATAITAIISAIAAVCGVILGWSARSRELKKETKEETKEEVKTDVLLRADMEYIKRGVDDIRIEQRAQGQRVDTLSERVTRVEESTKQAHKRIDRIEAEKG
jgi:hypothetical protein